jgi:hypothetical protein
MTVKAEAKNNVSANVSVFQDCIVTIEDKNRIKKMWIEEVRNENGKILKYEIKDNTIKK